MKKWSMIVLLFCFVITAWADEIRISCVGNSITQYKVAYPGLDPNAYPTQLGMLMGEGYVVQNFGVSGTTLLKNGDLSYWDQQAFTDVLNSEPDIVTIMLGTNDSKPQNWIIKDEFKSDYIALIDTFRSLPSNPEIIICLPPPATSSKYAISGDTIANEMIPIIQEVIQEKNTRMIDFHTFFTGKEHLFYDGIHPTVEGCWQFALLLYSNLKEEDAPDVQTLKDINLALNKPVSSTQSAENLNNIVDGDIHTVWYGESGESVTIDLGAAESVDMFQLIYRALVHFGYTIETSDDNTSWNTVVDASDNPETEHAAIESIEPIETRYVRINMTSLDPDIDFIKLAEIKVLQTAPAHAPILTYESGQVTSRLVRLNLYIISSLKGGYIRYNYDTLIDGIFENGIGYRLMDDYESSQAVRSDADKFIFAKYYKDHFEAVSDTIRFSYSVITDVETEAGLIPERSILHQNYPNPFNPSTQICFELRVPGNVKLTIYNCLGEKIKTPVNQYLDAGDYAYQFQAGDLPSGTYYCTLESNGRQIHRRMLLIK
ncbi:discoidin domain-containing protein [bacterium]|nr:discoidin domain-containing protein [bacterium]